LEGIFGYQAESEYGLILEAQRNTFIGAGKGFCVSLTPRDGEMPIIRLVSVAEGYIGSWSVGRRQTL
jgi:hypothetical protein